MPFKRRNTHPGQAQGSLRKKKNRQQKRYRLLFPSHHALSERINAIIQLIPDDFSAKETVRIALKKRQESVRYTAPEAIGMRWQEVANILSRHLPDPNAWPWAKKIAELFSAPVPV